MPKCGCLSPATFFLHLTLSQTYMEHAMENYNVSLYDNAWLSIFASLAAVDIVRKQMLTGNGTYIPIASGSLPCTRAHEDAMIWMVQVAMTYHCQGKHLKAQEWVHAMSWHEYNAVTICSILMWQNILITVHAACWGGDATFFDTRFNGFLHEMNMELLELFHGMIWPQWWWVIDHCVNHYNWKERTQL